MKPAAARGASVEDAWETFPCTMGDRPAFISFNHSFARRTDESFPHQCFASFRVALLSPTEEGFPAQGEFDELNALEDRLAGCIAPDRGVQVGRTTCGGHRDFAFYTSLSEQECLELIREVSSGGRHEIALLHEHDPQFARYWELLYPTLEDWQVIGDMRVEAALRERGDALTEPREIVHWARFPTAEARRAFLQALPEGVRTVEVREDRTTEGSAFVARLVHTGLPDHRSIHPFTIALARAAHVAGGTFEGWEAPLVRNG